MHRPHKTETKLRSGTAFIEVLGARLRALEPQVDVPIALTHTFDMLESQFLDPGHLDE